MIHPPIVIGYNGIYLGTDLEVCGRGSPGESLVGDRCMRGGLGDCDGGDPVCADGEG